jgi:hypothetical protein
VPPGPLLCQCCVELGPQPAEFLDGHLQQALAFALDSAA